MKVMASRVRYLVKAGGRYYAGSEAKAMLRRYSATPLKTWKDLIACAKQHGVPFWVFREPRSVRVRRSRYKQVCMAYRIGRMKHKLVFDPPVAHQGVVNVPANQFAGLAAQQFPDFMPQWGVGQNG